MESKIDATKRLQTEGRWKRASADKDREKARLIQEEGLTRRQANIRAWNWMIENYPPQTEEEAQWDWLCSIMAASRFPIKLPEVDQEDEHGFAEVWFGCCYFLCMVDRREHDDLDGHGRIVEMMMDSFPSPKFAVMGTLAMCNPPDFADLCEEKFSAVLERMEKNQVEPVYIEELECFLSMVRDAREMLSEALAAT